MTPCSLLTSHSTAPLSTIQTPHPIEPWYVLMHLRNKGRSWPVRHPQPTSNHNCQPPRPRHPGPQHPPGLNPPAPQTPDSQAPSSPWLQHTSPDGTQVSELPARHRLELASPLPTPPGSNSPAMTGPCCPGLQPPQLDPYQPPPQPPQKLDENPGICPPPQAPRQHCCRQSRVPPGAAVGEQGAAPARPCPAVTLQQRSRTHDQGGSPGIRAAPTIPAPLPLSDCKLHNGWGGHRMALRQLLPTT